MKTLEKPKKSVKIKLFGIIGDPIKHTLSPAMHNAAFKKLNMLSAYLPFHIKENELKKFFKEAHKWGISGFNITVPHKESAMTLVDKISPEAKAIGAINTVFWRNGFWHADNTDGKGYLKSLQSETRFNPRGKRIIILGAGGASRAVIHALSKKNPKTIIIMNRTEEKGRDLAQEFSKKFRKIIFQALPLEKEACHLTFPGADLVVNTTSIGLKATRFTSIDLTPLPKNAIVSDLVYRPLQTPFLKQAKKLKLKTHTGLGMLLHQGALAFKIWTRKNPPITTMHKALLDGLRSGK